MSDIVCKLTGDIGPGIEAHIIPRSFYDLGKTSHEGVKFIRLGDNPIARKSLIGEYDTTIVTQKGEAYFSDWDSYVNKLLIRKEISIDAFHLNGNAIEAIEIENYDYPKLKLFFLSLLWRAGVCQRPFFAKVDLGPHEERLRQHLLTGNPGTIDDFSVALGIYEDTPDYGFSMIEPHLVTDEAISNQHYKFSLGRFIACISFPGLSCPDCWNEIALSPTLPLRILNLGQFKASDFYREMRAGIQEMDRKMFKKKRQA